MDNDQTVKILNAVLADQLVLNQKLRNAHWNLVGPHFHDLHVLFEKQYDETAEKADLVAEHLRGREGVAIGSLAEAIEQARLSEERGDIKDGVAFAKLLLADHDAVIAQLRKDISTTGDLGDDATQDLLIELARGHEKMAWMLRSVVS